MTEGTGSRAHETIERDESLLLGALTTAGLPIFGARRHFAPPRN